MIRSGLNAIPISQWESGYCLWYTTVQSLRALILPQTLRAQLPQLNNELESLLKSTAITSSIGLLELTRSAMNLVSREMMPMETYLTLAVFYVCLSTLLTLAARFIERRLCNVNR
jgi:ABC-type amino acid transport system permease subunit